MSDESLIKIATDYIEQRINPTVINQLVHGDLILSQLIARIRLKAATLKQLLDVCTGSLVSSRMAQVNGWTKEDQTKLESQDYQQATQKARKIDEELIPLLKLTGCIYEKFHSFSEVSYFSKVPCAPTSQLMNSSESGLSVLLFYTDSVEVTFYTLKLFNLLWPIIAKQTFQDQWAMNIYTRTYCYFMKHLKQYYTTVGDFFTDLVQLAGINTKFKSSTQQSSVSSALTQEMSQAFFNQQLQMELANSEELQLKIIVSEYKGEEDQQQQSTNGIAIKTNSLLNSGNVHSLIQARYLVSELPVSETSKDFVNILMRIKVQRSFYQSYVQIQGADASLLMSRGLAAACTAACCARYRQDSKKKTFYVELHDENGEIGSCSFIEEIMFICRASPLFLSPSINGKEKNSSQLKATSELYSELVGQLALMHIDDLMQERGYPDGEYVLADMAFYIDQFNQIAKQIFNNNQLIVASFSALQIRKLTHFTMLLMEILEQEINYQALLSSQTLEQDLRTGDELQEKIGQVFSYLVQAFTATTDTNNYKKCQQMCCACINVFISKKKYIPEERNGYSEHFKTGANILLNYLIDSCHLTQIEDQQVDDGDDNIIVNKLEEFLQPYIFSSKHAKEQEHGYFQLLERLYTAYTKGVNRRRATIPNLFVYLWDRYYQDYTPNMPSNIVLQCAELFIAGYERHLIHREGSFHLKSIELLYNRLKQCCKDGSETALSLLRRFQFVLNGLLHVTCNEQFQEFSAVIYQDLCTVYQEQSNQLLEVLLQVNSQAKALEQWLFAKNKNSNHEKDSNSDNFNNQVQCKGTITQRLLQGLMNVHAFRNAFFIKSLLIHFNFMLKHNYQPSLSYFRRLLHCITALAHPATFIPQAFDSFFKSFDKQSVINTNMTLDCLDSALDVEEQQKEIAGGGSDSFNKQIQIPAELTGCQITVSKQSALFPVLQMMAQNLDDRGSRISCFSILSSFQDTNYENLYSNYFAGGIVQGGITWDDVEQLRRCQALQILLFFYNNFVDHCSFAEWVQSHSLVQMQVILSSSAEQGEKEKSQAAAEVVKLYELNYVKGFTKLAESICSSFSEESFIFHIQKTTTQQMLKLLKGLIDVEKYTSSQLHQSTDAIDLLESKLHKLLHYSQDEDRSFFKFISKVLYYRSTSHLYHSLANKFIRFFFAIDHQQNQEKLEKITKNKAENLVQQDEYMLRQTSRLASRLAEVKAQATLKAAAEASERLKYLRSINGQQCSGFQTVSAFLQDFAVLVSAESVLKKTMQISHLFCHPQRGEQYLQQYWGIQREIAVNSFQFMTKFLKRDSSQNVCRHADADVWLTNEVVQAVKRYYQHNVDSFSSVLQISLNNHKKEDESSLDTFLQQQKYQILFLRTCVHTEDVRQALISFSLQILINDVSRYEQEYMSKQLYAFLNSLCQIADKHLVTTAKQLPHLKTILALLINRLQQLKLNKPDEAPKEPEAKIQVTSTTANTSESSANKEQQISNPPPPPSEDALKNNEDNSEAEILKITNKLTLAKKIRRLRKQIKESEQSQTTRRELAELIDQCLTVQADSEHLLTQIEGVKHCLRYLINFQSDLNPLRAKVIAIANINFMAQALQDSAKQTQEAWLLQHEQQQALQEQQSPQPELKKEQQTWPYANLSDLTNLCSQLEPPLEEIQQQIQFSATAKKEEQDQSGLIFAFVKKLKVISRVVTLDRLAPYWHYFFLVFQEQAQNQVMDEALTAGNSNYQFTLSQIVKTADLLDQSIVQPTVTFKKQMFFLTKTSQFTHESYQTLLKQNQQIQYFQQIATTIAAQLSAKSPVSPPVATVQNAATSTEQESSETSSQEQPEQQPLQQPPQQQKKEESSTITIPKISPSFPLQDQKMAVMVFRDLLQRCLRWLTFFIQSEFFSSDHHNLVSLLEGLMQVSIYTIFAFHHNVYSKKEQFLSLVSELIKVLQHRVLCFLKQDQFAFNSIRAPLRILFDSIVHSYLNCSYNDDDIELMQTIPMQLPPPFLAANIELKIREFFFLKSAGKDSKGERRYIANREKITSEQLINTIMKSSHLPRFEKHFITMMQILFSCVCIPPCEEKKIGMSFHFLLNPQCFTSHGLLTNQASQAQETDKDNQNFVSGLLDQLIELYFDKISVANTQARLYETPLLMRRRTFETQACSRKLARDIVSVETICDIVDHFLDIYPLLLPGILCKKISTTTGLLVKPNEKTEKITDQRDIIDHLIITISSSNSLSRLLIESLITRCQGCYQVTSEEEKVSVEQKKEEEVSGGEKSKAKEAEPEKFFKPNSELLAKYVITRLIALGWERSTELFSSKLLASSDQASYSTLEDEIAILYGIFNYIHSIIISGCSYQVNSAFKPILESPQFHLELAALVCHIIELTQNPQQFLLLDQLRILDILKICGKQLAPLNDKKYQDFFYNKLYFSFFENPSKVEEWMTNSKATSSILFHLQQMKQKQAKNQDYSNSDTSLNQLLQLIELSYQPQKLQAATTGQSDTLQQMLIEHSKSKVIKHQMDLRQQIIQNGSLLKTYLDNYFNKSSISYTAGCITSPCAETLFQVSSYLSKKSRQMEVSGKQNWHSRKFFYSALHHLLPCQQSGRANLDDKGLSFIKGQLLIQIMQHVDFANLQQEETIFTISNNQLIFDFNNFIMNIYLTMSEKQQYLKQMEIEQQHKIAAKLKEKQAAMVAKQTQTEEGQIDKDEPNFLNSIKKQIKKRHEQLTQPPPQQPPQQQPSSQKLSPDEQTKKLIEEQLKKDKIEFDKIKAEILSKVEEAEAVEGQSDDELELLEEEKAEKNVIGDDDESSKKQQKPEDPQAKQKEKEEEKKDAVKKQEDDIYFSAKKQKKGLLSANMVRVSAKECEEEIKKKALQQQLQSQQQQQSQPTQNRRFFFEDYGHPNNALSIYSIEESVFYAADHKGKLKLLSDGKKALHLKNMVGKRRLEEKREMHLIQQYIQTIQSQKRKEDGTVDEEENNQIKPAQSSSCNSDEPSGSLEKHQLQQFMEEELSEIVDKCSENERRLILISYDRNYLKMLPEGLAYLAQELKQVQLNRGQELEKLEDGSNRENTVEREKNNDGEEDQWGDNLKMPEEGEEGSGGGGNIEKLQQKKSSVSRLFEKPLKKNMFDDYYENEHMIYFEKQEKEEEKEKLIQEEKDIAALKPVPVVREAGNADQEVEIEIKVDSQKVQPQQKQDQQSEQQKKPEEQLLPKEAELANSNQKKPLDNEKGQVNQNDLQPHQQEQLQAPLQKLVDGNLNMEQKPLAVAEVKQPAENLNQQQSSRSSEQPKFIADDDQINLQYLEGISEQEILMQQQLLMQSKLELEQMKLLKENNDKRIQENSAIMEEMYLYEQMLKQEESEKQQHQQQQQPKMNLLKKHSSSAATDKFLEAQITQGVNAEIDQNKFLAADLPKNKTLEDKYSQEQHYLNVPVLPDEVLEQLLRSAIINSEDEGGSELVQKIGEIICYFCLNPFNAFRIVHAFKIMLLLFSLDDYKLLEQATANNAKLLQFVKQKGELFSFDDNCNKSIGTLEMGDLTPQEFFIVQAKRSITVLKILQQLLEKGALPPAALHLMKIPFANFSLQTAIISQFRQGPSHSSAKPVTYKSFCNPLSMFSDIDFTVFNQHLTKQQQIPSDMSRYLSFFHIFAELYKQAYNFINKCSGSIVRRGGGSFNKTCSQQAHVILDYVNICFNIFITNSILIQDAATPASKEDNNEGILPLSLLANWPKVTISSNDLLAHDLLAFCCRHTIDKQSHRLRQASHNMYEIMKIVSGSSFSNYLLFSCSVFKIAHAVFMPDMQRCLTGVLQFSKRLQQCCNLPNVNGEEQVQRLKKYMFHTYIEQYHQFFHKISQIRKSIKDLFLLFNHAVAQETKRVGPDQAHHLMQRCKDQMRKAWLEDEPYLVGLYTKLFQVFEGCINILSDKVEESQMTYDRFLHPLKTVIVLYDYFYDQQQDKEEHLLTREKKRQQEEEEQKLMKALPILSRVITNDPQSSQSQPFAANQEEKKELQQIFPKQLPSLKSPDNDQLNIINLYQMIEEKFMGLVTMFLKIAPRRDRWFNFLKKVADLKIAQKKPISMDFKMAYMKTVACIEAKKRRKLQEDDYQYQEFGDFDIGVTFTVNRQEIWNSTVSELMKQEPASIVGRKLNINFEGEEGIDQGGITREWMNLALKEVFDPRKGFFIYTSNSINLQPNPLSRIIPEYQTHYICAGRLVALALINKIDIEIDFTRSFLKHILGKGLYIGDLADIDPELAKNLFFTIDNKIEELGVTFTTITRLLDQKYTVELRKNGFNIQLREDNKKEYAKLLANWIMTEEIRDQIEAFVKGFQEVIHPKALTYFDEVSLGLKLSGQKKIDISDMKKHTKYTGAYNENSQQIKWFWEVMEEFEDNMRSRFLFFIASTFKAPYEGFEGLPIEISVHSSKNPLTIPVAHTCFRLLELPLYPSKQILKQKLEYAIIEGHEGFFIG